VNTLKEKDMEGIWQTGNLSIQGEARRTRGHRNVEKIRRVHFIHNVLLESNEFDSVSFFTIILRDIKIKISFFFQNYVV
jgi:hypothetical protein